MTSVFSVSELATAEEGHRVLQLAGDRLRAKVDLTRGAELRSFEALVEGRWVETLYVAQPSSLGWRGGAPWLWPAVGRSFTPQQIAEIERTGEQPVPGAYCLDDTTYPMPCHGFVMGSVFDLEESCSDETGARMRCSLRSDERTRTSYPFGFSLSLAFTLTGNSLDAAFAVKSFSDGLGFSVGNHITVRTPFWGDASFDEWCVVSPATQRLGLTDYSLLSGDCASYPMSEGVALRNRELLNFVAANPAEGARWVELRGPDGRGLRVAQSCDREELTQPGDWLLVFYGDPDLGFFCPEPWLGRPNALNTLEGLVRLNDGESFTWTMRLELCA